MHNPPENRLGDLGAGQRVVVVNGEDRLGRERCEILQENFDQNRPLRLGVRSHCQSLPEPLVRAGSGATESAAKVAEEHGHVSRSR